jgi:hypothetical protein
MSDFAESLRLLRASPGPSLGTDDFMARVMSACGAEAGTKPRRQRRIGAWACGAAAVLAAAAAVAIALRTAPEDVGFAALGGHVAARGGGLPSRAATVQAFVARTQPGVAPALLEGADFGPGDGILVRYSNPTERNAYLMVFALDQRGEVHWIHPAYLNEHDSPSSLALPPRSTLRVLDEVAEPENPAPGPLRVYALLSDAPLRVKEVEATLSTQQLPVHELFPQAEVEEWRCTWRVR